MQPVRRVARAQPIHRPHQHSASEPREIDNAAARFTAGRFALCLCLSQRESIADLRCHAFDMYWDWKRTLATSHHIDRLDRRCWRRFVGQQSR